MNACAKGKGSKQASSKQNNNRNISSSCKFRLGPWVLWVPGTLQYWYSWHHGHQETETRSGTPDHTCWNIPRSAFIGNLYAVAASYFTPPTPHCVVNATDTTFSHRSIFPPKVATQSVFPLATELALSRRGSACRVNEQPARPPWPTWTPLPPQSGHPSTMSPTRGR